MLIFGASSDKVFSVDADLNKALWESHVGNGADKPPADTPKAACSGGLTAPVVMAGSSSALMHFASEASRTPAAAGIKPQRPSPYFPPLSQSVYPLRPTTLTELAALYAISSDGKLHVLNSSTGQDLLPSVNFVPPNAKVTSLNIWENLIYATTGDNCDGYRNALFAMDLLSRDKRVAAFVPQVGGFFGDGGTSIGNDGTVYVQVIVRARRCSWALPGDSGCSDREGSEGEGLLHTQREAGRQEKRCGAGHYAFSFFLTRQGDADCRRERRPLISAGFEILGRSGSSHATLR